MFELSYSKYLVGTSWDDLKVGTVIDNPWDQGTLGYLFALWIRNNFEWDGTSTIHITE